MPWDVAAAGGRCLLCGASHSLLAARTEFKPVCRDRREASEVYEGIYGEGVYPYPQRLGEGRRVAVSCQVEVDFGTDMWNVNVSGVDGFLLIFLSDSDLASVNFFLSCENYE